MLSTYPEKKKGHCVRTRLGAVRTTKARPGGLTAPVHRVLVLTEPAKSVFGRVLEGSEERSRRRRRCDGWEVDRRPATGLRDYERESMSSESLKRLGFTSIRSYSDKPTLDPMEKTSRRNFKIQVPVSLSSLSFLLFPLAPLPSNNNNKTPTISSESAAARPKGTAIICRRATCAHRSGSRLSRLRLLHLSSIFFFFPLHARERGSLGP